MSDNERRPLRRRNAAVIVHHRQALAGGTNYQRVGAAAPNIYRR